MHASSPPSVDRTTQPNDSLNLPVRRLRNVVESIRTVRVVADVAYHPFEAFLSRRALTVTGSKLGDLGGQSLSALSFMLKYDPTTAPTQPAHFIMSDVVAYFTPSGSKEVSLWQDAVNEVLNLVSVFLYATNYYAVSPTCNSYAELLHAQDSSLGGALVGAASSGAFFAAFLYSLWVVSGRGFKGALSFSALCPVVGNCLYAYALTAGGMGCAYVGRILVGMGSCEVVNRLLITRTSTKSNLTSSCARFVAAGAIGMSAGPFMAALLDTFAGR